ncbi:hypothetical protein OH76DRAFT_543306 [Lentinus brumalis]|uniref:Uncharacterized protein n=1 Tax=Lentinus brumalis TaxID=2498619 RepID=A0A371D9R1_9APHY|nr:hypothetical protein OH76DRAFT_543306 [Polyporus brumalis]
MSELLSVLSFANLRLQPHTAISALAGAATWLTVHSRGLGVGTSGPLEHESPLCPQRPQSGTRGMFCKFSRLSIKASACCDAVYITHRHSPWMLGTCLSETTSYRFFAYQISPRSRRRWSGLAPRLNADIPRTYGIKTLRARGWDANRLESVEFRCITRICNSIA